MASSKHDVTAPLLRGLAAAQINTLDAALLLQVNALRDMAAICMVLTHVTDTHTAGQEAHKRGMAGTLLLRTEHALNTEASVGTYQSRAALSSTRYT